MSRRPRCIPATNCSPARIWKRLRRSSTPSTPDRLLHSPLMQPFEALDAQIRSCTEFLQAHGYKVLTMHQRLPGGTREGDPPLTVSDFATWLGYSQDYV